MADLDCFSHKHTAFHGRFIPEEGAALVGYAALISAYDLKVPLPKKLCLIGTKFQRHTNGSWEVFTPRHQPEQSLFGHLIFALKYEGLMLDILKKLFQAITSDEIKQFISAKPTSIYSRKIWFLYEWLLQEELDIPDAKQGKQVPVLDQGLQYPGPERISSRHKIINNLPGVPEFCPLIFKTDALENFINMNLSKACKNIIAPFDESLIARAASYLLLKDSKASYAIEGEQPAQTRAERWGEAIGQAGAHPLSHDEFFRLQEIVISDFRFIQYGYRNEGGFIGTHQRSTKLPRPEHISAKWQDIYSLMEGLIKTNELLKDSSFDPVLLATSIAFGFVFIHPFEDGNGRIHRYLIHHVLAVMNFIQRGVIFPISAIILERINEYRQALESYSKVRLNLIKWRPTLDGNVEVLNDTADYYRYFDATEQAEFLYGCILETIEKVLPEEINFLKHHDELKAFITNYIDMPDHRIELLIQFLIQNDGKFSVRAKNKEFSALTAKEISTLEQAYETIFSSDK